MVAYRCRVALLLYIVQIAQLLKEKQNSLTLFLLLINRGNFMKETLGIFANI